MKSGTWSWWISWWWWGSTCISLLEGLGASLSWGTAGWELKLDIEFEENLEWEFDDLLSNSSGTVLVAHFFMLNLVQKDQRASSSSSSFFFFMPSDLILVSFLYSNTMLLLLEHPKQLFFFFFMPSDLILVSFLYSNTMLLLLEHPKQLRKLLVLGLFWRVFFWAFAMDIDGTDWREKEYSAWRGVILWRLKYMV